MESEAGHYTTFITYARKYGIGIDVEKRWREWDFEASVIENYGKNETIHGRTCSVSSFSVQFMAFNLVSSRRLYYLTLTFNFK
jgi:hypothetical protein